MEKEKIIEGLKKYRKLFWYVILAFILFFFVQIIINKNKQYNKIVNTVEQLHDSITTYKDYNGKLHAKITEVQVSKDNLNLFFGKKVDSISKELKIKEKQLQSAILLGTTNSGTITTTTNTVTKIVHDTLTGKNDTLVVETIKPYSDKWLDFSGEIVNNNFSAKYTIRDSLNIVSYWKRKGFLGLGKKEFFLDISSANPNTKITNISNFKITEEKSKRFGIGPQAGITWNGTTWSPSIGIGVHYDLIRF